MKERLNEAIQKMESKYFERGERDFSYELYHQLRLLKIKEPIEVTCETDKTKTIVIDDLLLENQLLQQFISIPQQRRGRWLHKRPDLLIHEYLTLDYQELAIEVKNIANQTKIYIDLAKLAVYCRGRLRYKKGILILVNVVENTVRNFPQVRNFLTQFPELEIWIVRHGFPTVIICGNDFKTN